MKRIIPCMDVRSGRVVKGVNFEGIRDVEDPVELAAFYDKSGADELVFYDIMASVEGREPFYELIKQVRKVVSIPLMVGGGMGTLQEIERVLDCGADKVSINSGAVKDRTLIQNAATRFEGRRIALALDAKLVGDAFHVFTGGGRDDTGIDAVEWAVKAQADGAGELVINSIDADGVKGGYDLPMLSAIAEKVKIPIIASGGAGCMEHFAELFAHEGMDAGLAASVFHFREVQIMPLKRFLAERGIPVNL